jgi:hypothetical protein
MRAAIALVIAACVCAPRDAAACSGAPVGPAGIAVSCAQPDPDKRNLRVSAQLGWVTIEHRYGRGGGELRRRTATASIAWRAIDSITLIGDFGAITGGDITAGEARYTVEPGARGGVGITWRAFDDEPWLPFVVFGASVSVLSSLTERDNIRTRLNHADFRTSMLIGKLFGEGPRVGPYVVGRTITGAMYWKYDGRVHSQQPGDRYQVGLGISTSAGELDAYAEVTPFGERSMVVGLGFSF